MIVTPFSHCVFLWSYNLISRGGSETPKTGLRSNNPLSCGWSEMPKTRLSPRLATVFFMELQPCFLWMVWNAENGAVATSNHCVFLRSNNPLSRGRTEMPKTRLSQLSVIVFFMELHPCFLWMVWNAENTVVTTFSHCVFYGVTPLFPTDGLKCRKHGCHNFQLSCFGVTTLFLVDGLKHRKRGCNHRETFTF